MPDYSRGKIYKITSGEMTYIGSTCEPTLAKRLANHVKCYKSWLNTQQYYTTSFSLIETGQYEITLVELCPCNSKDELTARERFYIETNECVNKKIPARTKQEWREDTREENKMKQQIYRDTNRDIINKRRREQRARKSREY